MAEKMNTQEASIRRKLLRAIFAFAPYGFVFIIITMWNSSGMQMLKPSTRTIPIRAHRISKLGMAIAIATVKDTPKKLTKALAVDGSHSSKNISWDQLSKFNCRAFIATENSFP